MKKLLAIILCLTLVFTFVACSPQAEEEMPATDESTTTEDSAQEEQVPEINSVADLEGKTIGVQLGTTGDIYAADIEGATIEQYAKGADAVLALKQGKVDAVIIDNEPAKVFVEVNPEMTIVPEDFVLEQYAICISKDNAELTALFNETIEQLVGDGTLDAILDKYINGVEGAQGYVTPEGTQYPNGQLKMATNAYFPPYEYYEGDEIVGIDAEFAKAICDTLGYELVIEDMEFDSIVPAVQSGKADFGAAGMTITEDRLASIDFTDSYLTGIQSIIVLK